MPLVPAPILLFLLSYTALAAGQVPGSDWETDPGFRASRAESYRALDEYVFPTSPPAEYFVSDALLVIKGGKIVFERYANGFGPDQRHAGWSMSKSALGALLGAAIADGKIALSDSICKYVAVPEEKKYCPIKVEHLVHQSSGLDWPEAYEDSEEPKDSAVVSILYGEGVVNMEKFVLEKHRPKYAPDTRWNYSSGDSNLLCSVLKNAIREPEWKTYPWTRIFERIGAKSFVWETDARGVYVASSFLHGSARDYARLGLLYLRKGEWNGKRILPADWIEYSLQPAPALSITKPLPNASTPEQPESYGAHWWLNFANEKFAIGQPWPANPPDVFAMLGHWGQSVFMVPGEDLVVVRFGNDRHTRISSDRLLQLAREYAK